MIRSIKEWKINEGRHIKFNPDELKINIGPKHSDSVFNGKEYIVAFVNDVTVTYNEFIIKGLIYQKKKNDQYKFSANVGRDKKTERFFSNNEMEIEQLILNKFNKSNVKNEALSKDRSKDDIKDVLFNLYNGIMNDYSIRKYTLGWKDVIQKIENKYKDIPKTDKQFSNKSIINALSVVNNGRLKTDIENFANELSINLETLRSKNEALSKDRSKDAKLKILVNEAKALIEAKMKMKEIAELRKIKNTELKESLAELKETSIIAKNVLFEVIKPYERKGLDSKSYISFVESSVNKITKEFESIHKIALKLSTKDKNGYKYFRTANNKDKVETGTIVESKITDWLKSIYTKIKDKVKSFKDSLSNISEKAKEFQSVNEAVNNNNTKNYYHIEYSGITNDEKLTAIRTDNFKARSSELKDEIKKTIKYGRLTDETIITVSVYQKIEKLNYYFDDDNNMIDEAVNYEGSRSSYKDLILDLLTEHNQLTYGEFNDMFIETGNFKAPEQSIYRNLIQLMEQNIVDRKKQEGSKAYTYFLNNTTDGVDLIDDDPAIETKPDSDAIVSILEQAKESISLAEQENYYKELAKSKEESILKMMEDFGATKIAIDDKILSIVDVKGSKYNDWNEYAEIMTTGKTVSSNVKKMAKSLFKTYNKVTQVSGSLRQFDNDEDLPEGTTGATFDWVLKKVVAKEDIKESMIKEGVLDTIKQVGKQIKLSIFRFFKFFERTQTALNKL